MSGIYIPGMEMPVCHFKTSESYNVHGFWMVYPDGKSKLHIMVGSDHWVCDAIPVPDHGRLIDADALYEKFVRLESEAMGALQTTGIGSVDGIKWSTILAERTGYKFDIVDAPTIIPADKEGER